MLDNPIYCGMIAYGRRKTEKVNGAVEEVIRNIINDPKFEETTQAKIQERIDTAEIEAEIKRIKRKAAGWSLRKIS